jgi:hypothetical protein
MSVGLLNIFVRHSVSSVGPIALLDDDETAYAQVHVSANVSAGEMRQVLHTLLASEQHQGGVIVALRDISKATPTLVPLSALFGVSQLSAGPFGMVVANTLPEADLEEYNHYRMQQSLRPHLRRNVTVDLDSTANKSNAAIDEDDNDDDATAGVDALNVSSHSSGTTTTTGTGTGNYSTATGATTNLSVHTAIGNAAHVIELSVVRIGTWEVNSKMKGELTLIIDEEKSVIQYRWRKPNMKKQTFATFVIEFAISLLLSAHVNETGSTAAAAVTADDVANNGKRKQPCDAEPHPFRIDWLLELSGPPVFFKSDDKPLKKTTERLKSASALADLKSRRADGGASPDWTEITDFTTNEQATTYRRHVCVVGWTIFFFSLARFFTSYCLFAGCWQIWCAAVSPAGGQALFEQFESVAAVSDAWSEWNDVWSEENNVTRCVLFDILRGVVVHC